MKIIRRRRIKNHSYELSSNGLGCVKFVDILIFKSQHFIYIPKKAFTGGN